MTTHFNRKHFVCTLDYCEEKHYAKGLCRRHWDQQKRGVPLSPRVNYSELEYPMCNFEGCENRSVTKRGRSMLCAGHTNQTYRGLPLKPLNYYGRGFTENGRVCKTCKEEKPLSEFYDRNQWRDDVKTGKSTQCRACYIAYVNNYKARNGSSQ